jgi:hypothetical protein
MKRFLITNPRYTGEASLLYNGAGVLLAIDCSQCNMNAETISHFKRAAPALESELAAAFVHPTVVVQSDIVITFDMWWKKYGMKVNKDRCEGLFNRLSKTEKIEAYYKLDKYHSFLRKKPDRDKLHPDTYLRSKAWLNDYKL